MITDQTHAHPVDSAFDVFVAQINDRFSALTGPIFETDATELFDAYLQACADPAERQKRTCSCCRKFIERFGGLATVGDDGQLVPALWDIEDVPEPYREALVALQRKVRRASISMPFLSGEAVFGKPEKGGWHHFAVKSGKVFASNGLDNAFQAASARRQAFDSVRRALDEYTPSTCATALRLLKDDALANSEAALGQAQFLVDLHAARDSVDGQQGKDNIVYRMVATAPTGFCHPRSSMIATLLDDIATGKSFEEAAASWAAKMHPLRYLRPQAAPTAGAIKAAEAAFEKLGAGTALQRRYATMADILETVWLPKTAPKQEAKGGLFASIIPKGVSARTTSMMAPATVMTLDKFRRTVLPDADKIEMAAPAGRTSFVALTSAVHADARPILQWDNDSQRNPVAWYIYHGGSSASDFNLCGGFYEVTAMTLPPHAWLGQVHPQQGEGIVLLLKNARDLRKCGGHSAIFPSCLKGEFHGFRSTIEAYSNTNSLAGFGEDNVAGLLLSKGDQYQVTLRVTSGDQVSDYRLDRWD
ncbi:hypothetical protein SAMN05518865_112131 [Duganella sp. CF458]|uniref:hypothetical protein n=1 Tax=Duganella sp. CF458 TaxID=1884368 RepID=UPI0008DF7B8C|nr:hypothetical protein [Duganella sp. CF458]SFG45531.1 hypothetical protein SAMN05518865_112131 [Duganella sp. CF458]